MGDFIILPEDPMLDPVQSTLEAIEHFKLGSPIYDAFSRLRVSNPVTLFESKQVVSEQNLLWDRGQVSGAGGTFLYSRNRASSTLTQAANTAGKYVRRTRRYFNYQPGKSQLIVLTAVMGPSVAHVHKRLGYFDESNGFYFGVNGESIFVALRSNVTGTPVETIAHQAQWNFDKLDGTGPSGIAIDTTRVQILWFDFEWLGAGRVRWGIFYRGKPYLAHEFVFSNEPNSTSVYMSTPALPITCEIENDGQGAQASIEQICCSVISEGGTQAAGAARSVNRGLTAISVTSANLVPVISIRTRTGFEFQTINILGADILGTANTAFLWALVLNPVLAGVDAAVWTAVGSSTIEFDIARTQANFITDGIVLDSGYVGTALRQASTKPQTFLGLGKRLLAADPKDNIVLAARNLSGNNTYYASLTYEESV